MAVEPGPALLDRNPRALEAAEEVAARWVFKALEAHPGLRIAGSTEVTSPSRALIDASSHATSVVLGSRKDEAVDLPVGPEHRVVVSADGSAEAAAAVGFAADRAATASPGMEVITCTDGAHLGHAVIHGAGCVVAVVGEGQG